MRHSQTAAARNHNPPQVQPMYTSFEDSVLEYADDNGCLDLNDACNLLNQHEALLTDYLTETGDKSLNAESLLAWLGY